MKTARAFAPATVANVACGFDLMGFALEGPGDIVEAVATDQPGARVVQITGTDAALPMEPDKNTSSVAAQALLDSVSASIGVELKLHKGIAPCSGIGSSAASAVAAVVATAQLLAQMPDFSVLLRACMEGERAATGFAHADNVAPSLKGGFVLVREGPNVTQIPAPSDLFVALIHPHTEVDTRAARAVLPQEVPLGVAVTQAGDCAALMAGLFSSDFDLIASALHDHIAEPVRRDLTPGFAQTKQAALEAGALGCSLSGSGPSIFAFCHGRESAQVVLRAMVETMHACTGLFCDEMISTLNAAGARVMD